MGTTYTHSSPHWWPETEAERTAVREQLERMLSSPLFRNSRRYPKLLRFAVERAVDGHTDHLKERTLGVEVFGRDPAYDTNLDPIVRITAVEVRKRIAQYYREQASETELRIDFPPGSYVPEFRLPPAPAIAAGEPVKVVPLPQAPMLLAPPAVATTLPKRGLRVVAFILAGAATLTAGAALWLKPWKPSALNEFWGPVLRAPGTVLLCMGDNRPADPDIPSPPAESTLSVRDLQRSDVVAFSDATTMSMLTGLFRARGKEYRIRRGSLLGLADLREGPVVLIGAYNNSWTMRLFSQTRFHFTKHPELRIENAQNPAQSWGVDSSVPYTSFREDFALVSRMIEPTTGRLVVEAGGLTRYGTLAAGEFLSDAGTMQDLERLAPRDWGHQNVQIVLGTKVVGENSGPPRILATYFW